MLDPGSSSLAEAGEDSAPPRGLRGWWLGLRLGTKLILSSTLLTALLVAGVLFVLSLELRRNAKGFLTESLARSQILILAQERENLRQLLWTSSLITRNPSLRAAIDTFHTESEDGAFRDQLLATIDNEVEKIAFGLNRDLLVVTDDEGRVLSSRGSAGAPHTGEDLSAAALVRRALDPAVPVDEMRLSMFSRGEELYLAGCVPIEVQGFTIGALLLGDRLDESHSDKLRRSYGGDVVLVWHATVVRSTLPELPRGARFDSPTWSDEGPGAVRTAAMHLGSEEYVLAPLVLGDERPEEAVTLYLLHSLSRPLRQQYAILLRAVLTSGALAVLIGGGLMWALGRSLLQRLERVAGFMDTVALTGDYSRRLGPEDRSRDELGRLSRAFDSMLDQIEHRDAELRRQIRERRSAVVQLHRKEEQLQQAQKMEALGRLAGGVAHDFNNLLTVITGYSELLLGRLEAASPLRGGMDEIRKAGERAAALTQQLLAFSRKQVLAPKVLSFNEVLGGMEKMLLRLIGEDVRLHIECDPATGQIKADPGQVEQVLLNLVVNSRDAMAQGGELTVRTYNQRFEAGTARHPAMPSGDWVCIRVEDTGCGMSPEVRERVFEPFYTTKEQGKGTGLGMATVYGIIKQSGGWIFIDSEVGRGTTIDIYFPRIAEVPDALAARQALESAPRGNETLLLVEDEEQVRRFTCQVLEMSGYVVIEARDGEEAVAVGEGFPQQIHLMLTDVVMPRMNGREAYERLISHHPGMKVLFTSGYTDRAIVQEGGVLDEGIPFLRKPFTGHALATRVREILDGVPVG